MERRTWNTPVREPWNPVIHSLLKAIDTHTNLYLKTLDPWHIQQAQVLRDYVNTLKTWIHAAEDQERINSTPCDD